MAQALLEEGLVRLGLVESMDRILPLLYRYIEEIELFNPSYGLVKVRDREELIVKHILDSLAPLYFICDFLENPDKQKGRNVADAGSGAGLQGKPVALKIADVGSGAGLPGIPLAICMPDAEFTLIERMGRRAGFLRDVIAMLNLSNVSVKESEMEELAALTEKRKESFAFNVAVFRAFKPLDSTILKKLFSLLAPDGILAAYKGRRQSIEDEMSRLGTVSWECLALEVPFLEEERNLVLLRKTF